MTQTIRVAIASALLLLATACAGIAVEPLPASERAEIADPAI